MKLFTKTQKMGLAAIIIGSSVLISRFMGLVRDKVISYWFGASLESDLYFTAFVIPDFINYLLAGGYFSITLLPILSKLFTENEEEGWRFFSSALLWVFLLITFFTFLGELLADNLVQYVAPGFSEKDLERLSFFLRIILPAQVFFIVGGCFNAILYLRKQFIVPSLSPLIYNGGIIFFGILLRERGMEGFCWGVLVGALVGNFLVPFLAVKGGGLKLFLVLWHRKMKDFLFLSLPLMLGQSIVVLDEQLVRVFGSMAGYGTVSHINYARRLMMVPVGVIIQAAGVASYPFLVELFSKKKMEEFFGTLRTALINTFFIVMPVVFGMALVAEPIVGLIFQQGRFEAEDTFETAKMFVIYLVSVPMWAFHQILGRGFYAVGDTVSPVVIGTISTFLAIPLFFYGVKWLGGVGVVGASVSGLFIYSLLLALWWYKRWGGKVFYGLAFKLSKYTFVGGLSFVVCFYLKGLIGWGNPFQGFLGYLWHGFFEGFGFGIFFLLFSYVFCKDELRVFIGRLIGSFR